MPAEPVLSRHRLPHPYRLSLTLLWLTPITLLTLAIILSRGLSLALLDPRYLLLALLMSVPALYIWREGVDVLPSGLIVRLHLPRYHPYCTLAAWHLDARPHRRVLTVWDRHNHKVLECRPGHLTDLPTLLKALRANVHHRNWPT